MWRTHSCVPRSHSCERPNRKELSNATWDDRSRQNGRKHGASPDTWRAPVRRVRSQPGECQRTRIRRRRRRKLNGRFREEAHQAARRLGYGAGWKCHRNHCHETGRSHGAGRHHHRWRQFVFQGRCTPLENSQGAGHTLSRCRHQRRSLGTGTRLLHDDRRLEGIGCPSGPYLQNTRARRRQCSSDAGASKQEQIRGRGLPILRPIRRRSLRQNGSQRHRVWPHAGLRRRVRHHVQRELEGVAGG